MPSIRHHLIVGADQRAVIHHRRHDGRIETRLLAEERITLDPPGIEIAIKNFYAEWTSAPSDGAPMIFRKWSLA